jgi:hypothetical protein
MSDTVVSGHLASLLKSTQKIQSTGYTGWRRRRRRRRGFICE